MGAEEIKVGECYKHRDIGLWRIVRSCKREAADCICIFDNGHISVQGHYLHEFLDYFKEDNPNEVIDKAIKHLESFKIQKENKNDNR